MSHEEILRKPEWIRVKLPDNNSISSMKRLLRTHRHCTVCEEAACPNLAECFNQRTATFLILGDICSRNCAFCNVHHGSPQPVDSEEPERLAKTILEMGLHYVVITSVTRDDLPDGGASHYAACIQSIRKSLPHIKIEILVPDFKHAEQQALDILSRQPCDVFNHNIETVPRLYSIVRPQADYHQSLELLEAHKKLLPHIPTKSGIMVGLGETDDELEEVMKDLRARNVDGITIGQYLQPSLKHMPVKRYIHPNDFSRLKERAQAMGFKSAACGPFVRSSYHAEQQVF